MTVEINHIGIEVPESMPDFACDTIVSELQASGLNIKVRKRPELGAMNALEWIIPTAIATYIFKSYFDGFLNEAGKDHYTILRTWLKKFADNGRLIKVHTIYASQSSGKRPNNNTQSKSVSLLLQTKSGKIIKLLFDNDLTKEDWDNAIDQLLNFAIENYEKYPKDSLTKELERLDQDRRQVYAIIDKDTKKLLFYGDSDLIHLHKNNHGKTKDKN